MKNVLLILDQPLLEISFLSLLASTATKINVEKTSADNMWKSMFIKDYDMAIISYDSTGNNLNLAKEALKANPNICVLIISNKIQLGYLKDCYRTGILGMIETVSPIDEIKYALKEVLAGRIYISEHFKHQLFTRQENIIQPQMGLKPLTNRELQLAILMRQGKRMSEIGKNLQLKPSTVSTFKTKIFTKLGIKNTLELVDLIRDSYEQ